MLAVCWASGMQMASAARVRGADVPENLENLVNLRVAREERLARAHLGKDAADGPHVDARRVLAAAEENLGGAVPERDDLVGVGAQGDAKGAGETEISELQVAVAVDEQVLRLEVAVEHTVAVAVADALAQLAHELSDDSIAQAQPAQRGAGSLWQGLAATAVGNGQRLHVLLEIQVEELKDEVQLVAVGVDNVEETHDVGVAHLLEQRDLADGGRRNTLVLGLEPDLLERNNATIVEEIARLVNHSVGSWCSHVG